MSETVQISSSGLAPVFMNWAETKLGKKKVHVFDMSRPETWVIRDRPQSSFAKDKTFWTVLGLTLLALGTVIALEHIVQHLRPIQEVAQASTPLPLNPIYTQQFGIGANGMWGYFSIKQ